MKQAISLILVLLACSSTLQARTWRVERDGSAGYNTIFAAMQVASPGDTLLIGPGRYDDFHPFVAPAWTSEAIVPVTRNNLTFIGAGPDSTIIGPTEMYLPGLIPEPVAIGTTSDVGARFENIGIENVYTGIYWGNGGLTLVNGHLSNYKNGIDLQGAGGGEIFDTNFERGQNLSVGISTHPPCGPVTVTHCSFEGPLVAELGIGLNGTHGVTIQDCHFDLLHAMTFSGSYAVVSNCTTSEVVARSIWVTNSAQAELFNNQLSGYNSSLYVDSWGQVSGSGNVFTGGAGVSTIHVSSQSHLTLNGNHILKSGEYAVTVGQYFYEITHNDLTGNFWGTSAPDLISEWIWDHNDDSTLRGYIDFLPYSNTPLPTEKKSLGSLRAMYR